MPFYQRHFLNSDVPSNHSNFVQIPIEAPNFNQIESVSNPRVSNNSLENTIDPRLLPPPSYEEVIVSEDSTEEPPPTYLESFGNYFNTITNQVATEICN